MGVNATDNDRRKLRELLADKIANVTEVIDYARDQNFDYELSIGHEIRRLKTMANGQPEGSDEQRETLGWVLAHEFALEDARLK